MLKFINYYRDIPKINGLYKALIAMTALVPLEVMLVIAMFYISIPLGVVATVVFSLVSLIAMGFAVYRTMKNRNRSSLPLLIAAFAFPLYGVLLYVFDPSLVGVTGVIINIVIPVGVLVLLAIASVSDETFDEKEDPLADSSI